MSEFECGSVLCPPVKPLFMVKICVVQPLFIACLCCEAFVYSESLL